MCWSLRQWFWTVRDQAELDLAGHQMSSQWPDVKPVSGHDCVPGGTEGRRCRWPGRHREDGDNASGTPSWPISKCLLAFICWLSFCMCVWQCSSTRTRCAHPASSASSQMSFHPRTNAGPGPSKWPLQKPEDLFMFGPVSPSSSGWKAGWVCQVSLLLESLSMAW